MRGWPEWDAAFIDGPDGFAAMTTQLYIIRRSGDDRVEAVQPDGSVITLDRGQSVVGSAEPFLLPIDALSGIRDAIDRRDGLPPSGAVERELRDALTVERGRVDAILSRVPGPTGTEGEA